VIAEIVAVGTELLLGQIANTNAQKIADRLASVGIDVYAHSVVGDNLERASETVRAALGRADVVVISGGLGPTPDDLTREAVASALGARLRRDERLAQEVRAIFDRLGRPMPEENLRQADLPEGAVVIPPRGTAPGFIVTRGDKTVIALPGVPWEMEAMLEDAVLPWLSKRTDGGVILSRQILVIGLGESLTHSKIADIVAAQSNPTIAYLAGRGQVRVRITAKAASASAAEELILPVADEIRTRLGAAAVPGWPVSLAGALGDALRGANATVAVAESLTGGLIGAELTRPPGASDYFRGSLVCYSNEAKVKVAGVDKRVLDRHGAVSEAAARALAEAAAGRFGSDLGMSATGAAGPEEHGAQRAGTVWVGATWRGATEARRIVGYGDRDNVRDLAVTSALDLGRRIVDGSAPPRGRKA
jgi:nicotinamide-nucleotide amidase